MKENTDLSFRSSHMNHLQFRNRFLELQYLCYYDCDFYRLKWIYVLIWWIPWDIAAFDSCDQPHPLGLDGFSERRAGRVHLRMPWTTQQRPWLELELWSLIELESRSNFKSVFTIIIKFNLIVNLQYVKYLIDSFTYVISKRIRELKPVNHVYNM